jgi:wobble nucleotide-excising tRNase
MLKKIISIKGVGAFASFGASGDVTFRAFTAIWGPNGVGKSTVCDILRSSSTSDPAPVLGRRSLAGTAAPEIELSFESGKRSFRDGAWDSNAQPTIHIFDSCYIHENLYVGDFVEHDQRKSLYRVIVGEQGVALAAAVDDLDARHREATADATSKRDMIRTTLPSGLDVDQYLTFEEDPDIKAKILAKGNDLAAVRQAEVIAKRSRLASISIPQVPADIDELLATTLEGISATAERLVREHVAHAKVREAWISEGLRSVKDDRCPFCGQDATATELLQAFRGYFSEGYGALKERIATRLADISSLFGDVAIQPLRSTVTRNSELGQEWEPLIGEAWNHHLSFETIEAAREEMLRALRQKEAAPLDALPGVLTAEPLHALRSFLEEVERYNAAVTAFNAQVDGVKAKAKAAKLDETQREMAILVARRDRFEARRKAVCEELTAANSLRKDLDKQKAEAKRQLDEHAAAILGDYQQAINRFLQMFGASFRITRLERRYAGGTPSSSYALEINNVQVELGDRKTSRSEPSFRNTLSAGDRSALALAFFLAQLDRDSNLDGKIVVFDDPFTSQDRARRRCTQQEIRRIASKAVQVIVFSHDEGFLAACCKDVAPVHLKTLQIRRVMNAPTLLEWDAAAPQSELLQDHQSLKEFLANGESDPVALRAIAGKIRLLLEGHLRGRFLGKFADNMWLGDMIGIARNNQDQIPDGVKLVDELGLINEYSKVYHHSNPNAQNEPIDETELKTWVERALAIADGF